jgi:hypothetical protein
MPGRFHHPKTQAPYLDAVALAAENAVLRRLEAAVRAQIDAHVTPAEVNGGAGVLQDGLQRRYVVEMSVGQQNVSARQMVLLKVIQNGARFGARVDDGTLQAAFVCDYKQFVCKNPTGNVLTSMVFPPINCLYQ